MLYFRMVAIRLHAIPCQMLFENYEDMVHFLLVLKVLFTQDSKVEDLFCSDSAGFDRACLSMITFSGWASSFFEMTLSRLYSDDR